MRLPAAAPALARGEAASPAATALRTARSLGPRGLPLPCSHAAHSAAITHPHRRIRGRPGFWCSGEDAPPNQPLQPVLAQRNQPVLRGHTLGEWPPDTFKPHVQLEHNRTTASAAGIELPG